MKVLMLVFNTFENDARVERIAKTLISENHQVHLVAIRKPGLPEVETKDGLVVRRINLTDFTPLSVADNPKEAPTDRQRKTLFSYTKASLKKLHSAARLTVKPILYRLGPNYIALARSAANNTRLTARKLIHLNSSLRTSLETKILNSQMRGRQASYGSFATAAHEVAKSLRPDLVHAHDFNTLLAAERIHDSLNVPYIYDSHELWIDRNRCDRTTLATEIEWERRSESRAIKKAFRSITVCKEIGTLLEKRYAIEPPVIIRNTPNKLPSEKAKESLRKAVGLPKSEKLLIYVGKATFYRGLEEALDALKLLPENYHLCVLGYFDSTFKTAFHTRVKKNKITSRVHTYGPVPAKDVTSWISEADLSLVAIEPICLSYKLALPNKLFESIQAGVPIVGADLPEISRIISKYKCGVTYPIGSPKRLAEAIQTTTENQELLSQLRAGIKVACEDLVWEKEQEELVRLYNMAEQHILKQNHNPINTKASENECHS